MALPKGWFLKPILGPIVRPLVRLLVGLIAVPLVRSVRRRYLSAEAIDQELEKDLEQWTRASLVLLVATKNVEASIASWLHLEFNLTVNENNWMITAARLLLAVGVVESMPDQQLFSLIHPGPPPLRWRRNRTFWQNIRTQAPPMLKGLACQHLNRSSPVLAIMAAIFSGTVGWVCYLLAITQYLIIGLVTSRDKAFDVLKQFDREVAKRRRALKHDFEIACEHDKKQKPAIPSLKPTPEERPVAEEVNL